MITHLYWPKLILLHGRRRPSALFLNKVFWGRFLLCLATTTTQRPAGVIHYLLCSGVWSVSGNFSFCFSYNADRSIAFLSWPSFIKLLIYMNKTLSGNLRELKNKGNVQLGNPKSGRSRLPEGSLTTAFHFKIISYNSNGVSQRSSQLELVAYESGRMESFD